MQGVVDQLTSLRSMTATTTTLADGVDGDDDAAGLYDSSKKKQMAKCHRRYDGMIMSAPARAIVDELRSFLVSQR